ncbi:hypothetical protein Y032_0449g1662 [Ancylostoma ceylanicum]|uniref:Uncharacterized protein n=1 Tax=Ancylostoma ceylanicum TaxID=53326 RepID=A0A016X0K2_9BILA|nr:hypothetical protein Y032_0449g1662 [Ancylostoma ceylanicum]
MDETIWRNVHLSYRSNAKPLPRSVVSNGDGKPYITLDSMAVTATGMRSHVVERGESLTSRQWTSCE